MSERQYGMLDEIRKDHTARYRFTAKVLLTPQTIVDAACGCGYGAYILAQAGHAVYALDASQVAISYGLSFYDHPRIEYLQTQFPCKIQSVDVAISFETLEHLERPMEFLQELRLSAKRLIISVPNEEKMPFFKERFPYHIRHYTKAEFEEILNKTGWKVNTWYGQETAYSNVVEGVNGRTLIADCAWK